MNEELLRKLTSAVNRLNALLQDPQPGLSSWCLMVGEAWKEISDLWGEAS